MRPSGRSMLTSSGPDIKEVTTMAGACGNMVGGMVRVEVEESVAAQVGEIAFAFCLLLVATAAKGMV